MGSRRRSVWGVITSRTKERKEGCVHSGGGGPQRLQKGPQTAERLQRLAERAGVKKHQGQGTPVARGAAVETSRLWHPHFASICSLVDCPPL